MNDTEVVTTFDKILIGMIIFDLYSTDETVIVSEHDVIYIIDCKVTAKLDRESLAFYGWEPYHDDASWKHDI